MAVFAGLLTRRVLRPINEFDYPAKKLKQTDRPSKKIEEVISILYKNYKRYNPEISFAGYGMPKTKKIAGSA